MTKTLAISLIALALTSACTPPGQVPTQPPPAEPKPRMDKPKMLVHRGPAVAASSTNAPRQLQVDLYQLQVPYGTISRNTQFWKRIDEQSVDVSTYDVLFKNGVRVGEAPIAEYERFAQLIKDQPASHRVASLVAPEGKEVDLEIRKEVPTQLIWHYNGMNELIGWSYDRCENYVALSYQPAPRKNGTLRIVLCPVVKEHRKRLEWLAGNKEQEVAFTQPRRYYDVNLRADVAVNSFLIVAPSAESTWPGSIGNRFFVQDGAAEQMENVLLFVPKQVAVMEQ